MYIISNYMPHITSFWIFEDVTDELVDCYLSHRIVALDLYNTISANSSADRSSKITSEVNVHFYLFLRKIVRASIVRGVKKNCCSVVNIAYANNGKQ